MSRNEGLKNFKTLKIGSFNITYVNNTFKIFSWNKKILIEY